MITNSKFDPKCYQVTKVMEMFPQGVIKLSLKQDDFDEDRDNKDLQICNYYTDEGNILVNIEAIPGGTSTINWKVVTDNGLDDLYDTELQHLTRGKASYFEVIFSDDNVDSEWEIMLINDADYEKDEVEYYTNLIAITEFEDNTIAVKPGKASSLVGKKFRLSVSDINGNYYSSVDMEVM